jgi:hypothetical protein
MAAKSLTPAEVTELCTAAQAAWDASGPSQTTAKFQWRGKTYIATHSTFRLLVHTVKGEPVACRYD